MIWLLVDSRTVGGIERHIAVLAQALRRAGEQAEAVLLAGYGPNPWHDQLMAANVSFRTLDGTTRGLLQAVRENRPALLHTHGYKANILGRLVGRLTATPVVATYHAGERGAFPVSAYQAVDEWTSFLSGRIAVSEVIQLGLPFPSTHVQNFIVMPPQPAASNLPRRAGFVGRLSYEKGPDRFCEIARRCAGLCEWHIWGDGPERLELEQKYAGSVTFHGLVTDLGPVWSSLGLLVMPSRAEGLPMAALEALTAGIPIAASSVGGLPTLVDPGRTGWLFDGEDLDGATRAISAWTSLDEAAQQGMRRTCWSFVQDTFSDVRQLPRILNVYRRAGWAGRNAADTESGS